MPASCLLPAILLLALLLGITASWAMGRRAKATVSENLARTTAELGEKIETIKRENAALVAILGGMAEGVMVTDMDGAVLLTNRSLCETFGLNSERVIGRSYLEALRHSEISRLVSQATDTRTSATGEVNFQVPDELYFQASCVPISLEGAFTGTVLVLHDVTRLRLLERVRRDFVANMTHELKTPITSISLLAELMLEGGLEDKDEAGRYVGIIKFNSHRLAALTEDMLTLSKIESGDVKLELRSVSAREACLEAVSVLRPKIDLKALSIAVDIKAGLEMLLADRDKLYRIMLNVLDNAVKYTPEGGSVTRRARKHQHHRPV